MDNHEAIWDSRYEKVLRGERTLEDDPWLKGWLRLVPRRESRHALDVGCGFGQNTRLLLDQGFEVSAIDISERALELCRREAPQARVERADIRESLPFSSGCFELIVANLSLHYFPWDMTEAIVIDVANRLVPGGLFAGRFNSNGRWTRDRICSFCAAGNGDRFRSISINQLFFKKSIHSLSIFLHNRKWRLYEIFANLL
ncbi:MAG: class I SAM-dependent methyltransferase [Desulfobacterales bacterium]